MGKQIVATLTWIAIIFITLSVLNYFAGADGWLGETIKWVTSSAIGYFLGYGKARGDENR